MDLAMCASSTVVGSTLVSGTASPAMVGVGVDLVEESFGVPGEDRTCAKRGGVGMVADPF